MFNINKSTRLNDFKNFISEIGSRISYVKKNISTVYNSTVYNIIPLVTMHIIPKHYDMMFKKLFIN